MASNSKNLAEMLNTDVTVTATDIADGAVTTAKLADDAVTPTKVTDQIIGRKNLIINGDMQVAQRGASQANICSESNGYFTVDRWLFAESNVTSGFDCTMSQYIATEGGTTNQFTGQTTAMKIDVTTAAATLTSGNYVALDQRIEGSSLQHLKWGTSSGESITVSFWVYSQKTGDYSFSIRSLQNSASYLSTNGDRRYVTKYTINSSATWEKKTITIPADTVQPIMRDASDYVPHLSIQFGLCGAGTRLADSSSNYAADTWYYDTDSTVAYVIHPDQVNFFDSTSNNFFLTGVQLEVGDTATPFENRSYGEELTLCQRYYQTLTPSLSVGQIASNNMYNTFPLKNTMRDAPTTTLSSGTSVLGGGWTFNAAQDDAIRVIGNGSGNINIRAIGMQMICDAEL